MCKTRFRLAHRAVLVPVRVQTIVEEGGDHKTCLDPIVGLPEVVLNDSRSDHSGRFPGDLLLDPAKHAQKGGDRVLVGLRLSAHRDGEPHRHRG